MLILLLTQYLFSKSFNLLSIRDCFVLVGWVFFFFEVASLVAQAGLTLPTVAEDDLELPSSGIPGMHNHA